ncbi:MAG: DegT/DnrJ/EryC1/StrS family aminotransferase [Candidatus Sumerlaeia bacterium]|nr:DegT/DnrJ/EryC1/StrS family aminotransferase [Candidatus Sumerlaeia bacterium]
MHNEVTRRRFLSTAAGAAGVGLTIRSAGASAPARPALLGGKPVRTAKFPSWPVFDKSDEQLMIEAVVSGKWNRVGKMVPRFEEEFARLTGTKACLATNGGTSALLTSLMAFGVQPGDEVILPPYTFVACVNVVLALNAMPVFVDTDPETFQIDHRKIEAAITEHTKAIMPVHLGGNVANLDAILALAKKHKIPVVEDTCQSHLAEWKGRKAGSYGETGAFSFQATKNLNCGEGGAIISNDEELMEKCYAFHNNGRGRKSTGYTFTYTSHGLNLRMTEFQAAMLLAQMPRLEAQAKTRSENAEYLTSLLSKVPGILPAKQYEGTTRNAYHLYMFRYKQEEFGGGLSRAQFMRALDAEGINCSGGYGKLNEEPFIKNALTSRGGQRIFPRERVAQWETRNKCPENDRLTTEAVWFTQNMLLGPRSDMDQIAEAILKIKAHAGDLAKKAKG